MMEKVIEVSHLTKEYKNLKAIDDLSFNVYQGEILGLLGPNGCGKSTTINSILSLLKYQEGSIKVFGKEMKPDSYDLKAKIGVIFQEVAVFDELNVYDNINYFCGLYIRDKKQRKQYVDDAINLVGLNDFKKFLPKQLSGGLLRRLNIACGIAHKPKLIFLDEPTVAVDPQSRNRILEGIKKLNEDGATIIYTSHYMEEIEQLCSKILIMDGGKNVAIGTKEELKKMIKNTETIMVDVIGLEDSNIEEIRKLSHVYSVKYDEKQLLINCSGGKHNIVRVLDYFQNNNISIGSVYSQQPTLNDVFLEITGKELRD